MTHSDIVNSNHDGSTSPFKAWRNDGKGLIDIRRTRATELRDLFKAHLCQLFTCRQKCFFKGQIGARVGVIRVRRVEQG